MAKLDNSEIGAIDDIYAACSAINESVMFMAERHRFDLTPADANEMGRILDSTLRNRCYLKLLRAVASRNGHASKDGARSRESLRMVASGED